MAGEIEETNSTTLPAVTVDSGIKVFTSRVQWAGSRTGELVPQFPLALRTERLRGEERFPTEPGDSLCQRSRATDFQVLPTAVDLASVAGLYHQRFVSNRVVHRQQNPAIAVGIGQVRKHEVGFGRHLRFSS
jgi:hypothetical protein